MRVRSMLTRPLGKKELGAEERGKEKKKKKEIDPVGEDRPRTSYAYRLWIFF